MALVIALRVGQDFYVNDERVVVSWIDSPYRFGLKVKGEQFEITDSSWVEVLPGAKVTAGVPRSQYQKTIVKVMIDAPGSVVLRGALYKRKTSTNPICPTCNGKGVLHHSVMCKACNGHGCVTCDFTGKVTEGFTCPDCPDCGGEG